MDCWYVCSTLYSIAAALGCPTYTGSWVSGWLHTVGDKQKTQGRNRFTSQIPTYSIIPVLLGNMNILFVMFVVIACVRPVYCNMIGIHNQFVRCACVMYLYFSPLFLCTLGFDIYFEILQMSIWLKLSFVWWKVNLLLTYIFWETENVFYFLWGRKGCSIHCFKCHSPKSAPAAVET